MDSEETLLSEVHHVLSHNALSGQVMPKESVSQFIEYVTLLQAWNERMDLVAPASFSVQMERHVLDSLLAWALLKRRLGHVPLSKIVDVGSGAGLPGVIMGILSPEASVTLVEPREKRAIFLKEVKRKMKLANLQVLAERYEVLGAAELGKSQLFVSRALGDSGSFLSWSAEMVAFDGAVVQMVGKSWKQEDDEAYQRLGFGPPEVLTYELPRSEASLGLAVFSLKQS